MEELIQRLADKRPLSLAEAEGHCPGLRGLERPGKHPFLNCQLGRVEVEPLRIVGRTELGEFNQLLYVSIFHLIGFGPTWRAAIAMVKQKELDTVQPVGGLRCL